jgi:hypothetical protein
MFTPEQKHELLTNLDIEGTVLSPLYLMLWATSSRPSHTPHPPTRITAFRNRHERQLTYIPHLVRGMTMTEFGDKYDGEDMVCMVPIFFLEFPGNLLAIALIQHDLKSNSMKKIKYLVSVIVHYNCKILVTIITALARMYDSASICSSSVQVL